jgi:hypothetical protein
VSLARLPEASDCALTLGTAAIGEVILRGRRDLLERHHLLRELSYLRRQMGLDVIRDASQRRLPTVRISLHDWSHPAADVRSFDRLLESTQREGECSLVLWCTDWLAGSQSAVELLNRYQRLLPLPSTAVVPPELDTALRTYHALFRPYAGAARERHDLGLDTWRWLLRLTPGAGLALQLAALFHDLAVGELETLLEPLPLPRSTKRRTVELSLYYDELGRDPELTQLRTARALSFLSLESWRFERQHGTSAVRAKAQQLLLRLDSEALCVAATTRQPRAVSEVLNAVLITHEPAGTSVWADARPA